jgi:TRAP-type C4-dicarboxylate transport system permease small subunit
MCAILIITMVQIGGRLSGYNFRGLTDYAGYFMAASAFLAFAHTLNKGAHIRIELLLSIAGKRRRVLEIASFAAGIAISVWFAYYSCDMVYWSYQLGDISTGQDATPLWVPQMSMAIGAVLFAVAMADHGLRLLICGDHGIEQSADVT